MAVQGVEREAAMTGYLQLGAVVATRLDVGVDARADASQSLDVESQGLRLARNHERVP
jgi:hypothetical protein